VFLVPWKERLDSASIGELLDVELPLKITALAEEPAQQATKVGAALDVRPTG
jgi:hypothetical protein